MSVDGERHLLIMLRGQKLSLFFAAAGVLIGTGWVFAATLPQPILVFSTLSFLGAMIAFALGVRQSKFDQPILRLLSGAMILGIYVVAIGMPIGAKRIWSEQRVRQLPVLTDATTYIAHHSIVSGDGYPDYGAFYLTSLSLAEAAEAVADEFRRAGWKVVPDEQRTGKMRQFRCYRNKVSVVCELSQWPPTSKTTVHIKHQDWWLGPMN